MEDTASTNRNEAVVTFTKHENVKMNDPANVIHKTVCQIILHCLFKLSHPFFMSNTTAVLETLPFPAYGCCATAYYNNTTNERTKERTKEKKFHTKKGLSNGRS